MQSSKGARAVPIHPDAYSVAVLNGVAANLVKDAETLTDAAMVALAECRRASGIEYFPESCVAIRDAVRAAYIRSLADRLISGMSDDPGATGFSE